jgi:uroporphyrinogen-III synthase
MMLVALRTPLSDNCAIIATSKQAVSTLFRTFRMTFFADARSEF